MNVTRSQNVHPDSVHDYGRQFQVHQDLVREHLIGKCEESNGPLLPSFFPPASFWTASEKELFFHGLSVFSRLRPDLIAEHIKTKSTFDVCLYLDALHTGYLKECSGTSVRDELEPALEVSEQWIEHEEILSEALASYDTWGPGSNIDRSQLDVSPARSPRASQNYNLEKPSDSQDFSGREKRDEFLGRLDSTCLTVMERLIREAQQDVNMEDSVPSLAAGSGALDVGLEDVSPAIASNNDPDLSDSTQAGNAYSFSQTELQRRIKKRLYMRRRRAQAAGRTSYSEAIKLRPGRQTKLRKPPKPRPTTYKTKNKQNTMEITNSETVDEAMPLEGDSDNIPAQSGADQMDEDAEYELHTKGGITKPYRVRNICLQHGLDGQTLVGMDLSFFHLSTIGRLLRLYNSLDKSPRDLDAVSISASSLQILTKITTEFVSKIIHRAIITKEQEIRLKRSLKVWKYDRDEINGENVTECLKSMGFEKLGNDDPISRILGQGGDEESTTKKHGPIVNEVQSDVETSIQSKQNTPDGTAHPAKVILPASLSWCSLPSYTRLYPSNNVISPDMDEEELIQQLEDENELDTEDTKRSREFEASLWERCKLS